MPDPNPRSPSTVTVSESAGAAMVATLATIVVAAYFIDLAGWPFTPALMLLIAIAAAAIASFLLGRRAVRDDAATITFVAIVAVTFGWLIWIARPSFLPLGSGPDLTHHLLLIQYIEQNWRLVHVPGVQDYLGEMVYYTPGSHIITALAGVWARSTGFHVMHAVMAGAAALKAGFVFLIAMRVLPRNVPRGPIAAIGSIALFASQIFFLGSFADYSFLAQVVSEVFALGMWWQLTVWEQQPGRGLAALLGLTGSALFLTWPMLIGPPLVVLGALVILPHRTRFATRVGHAAIAVAPILLVAVLFSIGQTRMIRIVATGGEAVWPTVHAYGWWFVGLSTLGLAIAAIQAAMGWSGRTLILMTAAIVLESASLYVLATWHSNVPYMSLKMFYMLLFPQAVGVAVALGTVWWSAARIVPAFISQSQLASRLAWVLPAIALFIVGRPLVGAPKSLVVGHHPATSAPLEQAALWARAHVPSNCVEYLVGDDETAYWLHLAMFGNPRRGRRTADNATYQLTPTLVRWLTSGGLPYAIADLPTLPSGVRDELDIVEKFDTAAVVKRRGPSTCDEK